MSEKSDGFRGNAPFSSLFQKGFSADGIADPVAYIWIHPTAPGWKASGTGLQAIDPGSCVCSLLNAVGYKSTINQPVQPVNRNGMNLLAFGFGNFGGPDLFILLLIVLVLFGAKKLPELARGLGQSMNEFRKAREEFERELHSAAIQPPAPQPAPPPRAPEQGPRG
jgi:sec-independent protein translocase protein TatA